MKTIGIIGGFGPEATAEFYLRLVKSCRSAQSGRQPHIIMRNVPVPRNLEHDALVLGKNLDKFVPLLISTAQNLERDGADVIVLPCNTLHVHEDAIRKALKVQFISIIEETKQFLEHQKLTRLGFLGSRVTVRENLFRKRTNNIAFVTVDKRLQRQIDRGLDQFVGNQDGTLLRIALNRSFASFKRKRIDSVLVACTDFHSFCPKNFTVHDTLDILVRATANML